MKRRRPVSNKKCSSFVWILYIPSLTSSMRVDGYLPAGYLLPETLHTFCTTAVVH